MSNGSRNLINLFRSGNVERLSENLNGAWLIADVDGASEIQKRDELDPATDKKHVDRQSFEKCFFSDWEAVGYFAWQSLKEKLEEWECESLRREKEERHAICRKLVEEYEQSPAARQAASTNGRNSV